MQSKCSQEQMISFSEENAEKLVLLAHEYQMTQVMSLCEKYLLRDPPSLSRLVLADKYGLTKLSKVCMEFAKKTNLDTLKKEKTYEQIEPVLKVEILEHHIDILTDDNKSLKREVETHKPKSEERLKCLKEIQALAQGQSGECRECLPRKEELGIHRIGEKERCVNCKKYFLDSIKGKLLCKNHMGYWMNTEVMN